MSSTVTVRPAKGVRGIGLFSIIAGIILFLAGAGTWAVVADQLSAENITVSDDADFFAGRHVNGPLTAYAQAEVINKHALEATGGETYAELPQDDPDRAIVQNASFLRASLFTSVVAFGVAALVMGLGVLFVFMGIALRKLAGGPSVAVETPAAFTSSGDLSDASRRRAPAHAAPATPTAPTTPSEPPATSPAPVTPATPATAVPSTPADPLTPTAPGSSPEAAPGTVEGTERQVPPEARERRVPPEAPGRSVP